MAASGVEVRDLGLERIMRGLSGRDIRVQVGVQGSEAASDHGGITNVQLAVVHEFGSPAEKIPARSFLRSTMDEKEGRYGTLVLRGLRKFIDARGLDQVERILGVVGEVMVSDVKKKIRSNIPPALSPRYARRRLAMGKGTRTLNVTGQLLNSITWRLVQRGGIL